MNKVMAKSMVIYACRVATEQYDLDKKFADELASFLLKDDNLQIPINILEEWGCLSGSRVDLTQLANPITIRPCPRLATLFNNNGMPRPHDMFYKLESDPNLFNRMVYTYRQCFDLLYCIKLPHVSLEEADHFIDNASLFQLENEITTNLGW